MKVKYYGCPECKKKNGIEMRLGPVTEFGFKAEITKCECGFQDTIDKMIERASNKSENFEVE